MNIYEFMSSSPWLTFFLAMILARAATLPFRAFFRHLNIRKAGWPPAHCDAGGNLVEKDGHMAKAGGRKRTSGVREPNGRLQRPSKAEREAARLRREAGERATVLAQPHRRGNYDQLCASALGRHVLDAGLRRELYDAGEEYAETVRRWRALKGVPVGLSAIGLGNGGDIADETVRRLCIRLDAMRQAVTRSGGPATLCALDRIALDHEQIPGAISFRVTGALITLAEHLGLIAVNAHPYRAGRT